MSEICKNCQAPLFGNYCAQCGQKGDTHRITFAALLHDIPHTILHVDKGLLYTLKELLIRPGKSIAEYLKGQRVKHFKPFAYLIILTSVSSVFAHFVNTLNTAPSATEGIHHFADRIRPFFLKYPSLLFSLMIPIISLATWWFYKNRQFNYWENIVLNTYLTAQFNICLLLLYVFELIVHKTGYSFTPLFILYFTYLGFSYGQFFSSTGKRVKFFQILLLSLIVAFLYVTGFSFSGVMSPWWG